MGSLTKTLIYPFYHNAAMQNHQHWLLPYAISAVMIALLAGIFVPSLLSPASTGAAETTSIADIASKDVYCLREGRDGANIAVYDKDSCCFLIANADRCRAETDFAYYRGRDGSYEGYFDYDYACFGGSTQRVYFGETAKVYCDFAI